MKCQFEDCEKEARKCVRKDKISSGYTRKNDFWHCGEHREDELSSILESEQLSMQIKNPFVDAKCRSKMKPKTDR